MLYKVISEDGTSVTLGNEDGNCKTVTRDKLSFYPVVGDMIEEFYDNEKDIYYYVKAGSIKNKKQNIDSAYNVINPGKKRVKKSTYLLLCFFLGGFGAHKFYSGKIDLGILYLLFCWTYIPIIVSIVEWFIAANKNKDEDGYFEI